MTRSRGAASNGWVAEERLQFQKLVSSKGRGRGSKRLRPGYGKLVQFEDRLLVKLCIVSQAPLLTFFRDCSTTSQLTLPRKTRYWTEIACNSLRLSGTSDKRAHNLLFLDHRRPRREIDAEEPWGLQGENTCSDHERRSRGNTDKYRENCKIRTPALGFAKAGPIGHFAKAGPAASIAKPGPRNTYCRTRPPRPNYPGICVDSVPRMYV